ncbi:MAG: FAD-binding oxidoreductase [Microthrixaceae bacterium]|nr:FAD-binding oxidoreductase [Microthrixaceae bacterium]
MAIVGGGFTGLWTALQLRQADPSLTVAVIEREVIGFGASGRNGGFAMTLLDMSLAHLRRNHGDAAARAAHEAVATSVTEMGEAIDQHDIKCEWRHGGLMVVATNRPQQERIDADLAAAEALGLEGFRHLSAAEAQAEVHSPTYVGGLHEDHCGVLHPAKLARGLAGVASRSGVEVFERSDVTAIDEATGRIRITTPRGSVRAHQVVLATNAWASETEWFRNKVVPLYTYIAMTEPLTVRQWEEVGWDSHCGIEDKRNYVHYYRRTLDGRILWGGSDGVIHHRGRIAPRHDRSSRVLERLTTTFHRTFPQLRDVGFTHHWGDPWASQRRSCRCSGPCSEAASITDSAATATVSPRATPAARSCATSCWDAPATSRSCASSTPVRPGFRPNRCAGSAPSSHDGRCYARTPSSTRTAAVGEMEPALLKLINRLG